MHVVFDHNGLTIDGRRFSIIAGEFHYWRVNPLYWDKILDLMKAAGLNTVSTYICWDFHEPSPGEFDFEGRTNHCRNLVEFLELCQKKDLKLILKPGPVIGAEWPTLGPPPDVYQLERLHPRFLERSREWIKAVCGVIGPFQATHGGPVILVQVDNEVYFPYTNNMNALAMNLPDSIPYNESFVLELFVKWLKDKYGTTDLLNKAWGTNYASWNEIATPSFRACSQKQILDSFDFTSAMIVDYLKICKSYYIESGITVPVFANMGQFLTYIDWTEVERITGSIALDNYMPNMLPGSSWEVASWYFRLQSARSRFAWSAEFQGGLWIGMDQEFGIITPQHVTYHTLLAAACGLNGFNHFMFVERDDWHYGPVNAIGKVRTPEYKAFSQVYHVLSRLEPGSHLAKVGLIWSLTDNRLKLASQYADWVDILRTWMETDAPKEFPVWWETFVALSRSDWDFDLIDLTNMVEGYPAQSNPDRLFKSSKPVLIYAGTGTLSQSESKALETFLETGGKLVVIGDQKDSRLRSLPFLKKRGVALCPPAPEALERTLVDLTGGTYLKAPKGLMSFAYELEDRRHQLFVVNVSESEVAGAIEVAKPLRSILERGSMTELTDWCLPAPTWEEAGLRISVPAKTVRAFKIEARD